MLVWLSTTPAGACAGAAVPSAAAAAAAAAFAVPGAALHVTWAVPVDAFCSAHFSNPCCPADVLPTPDTCAAHAPQLLIVLDMALNFRVARYKHGQLVTCKRTLALDYLKGYFTVDLLSGKG